MSATDADGLRVHPAAMAAFTRQLGLLLDGGVDLLRALPIASQQASTTELLPLSKDLAARLEDGQEFHQAIAAHPDFFGPFYVELVRQGEKDGMLAKALLSVAGYLDSVAAARATAEAPVPAAPPPSMAVPVMATLGVLALGAGIIWTIAMAQPEVLPLNWLGPLAAFWAAVCLLAGAALLSRLRRSGAPREPAATPVHEAPEPPAAPLPQPERELAAVHASPAFPDNNDGAGSDVQLARKPPRYQI